MVYVFFPISIETRAMQFTNVYWSRNENKNKNDSEKEMILSEINMQINNNNSSRKKSERNKKVMCFSRVNICLSIKFMNVVLAEKCSCCCFRSWNETKLRKKKNRRCTRSFLYIFFHRYVIKQLIYVVPIFLCLSFTLTLSYSQYTHKTIFEHIFHQVYPVS